MRFSLLSALTLTLLCCSPRAEGGAPAATEPVVEQPPEAPSTEVEVPAGLRDLALSLPAAALSALRLQQWGVAAPLLIEPDESDTVEQAQARAFLAAWAYTRDGHPELAAQWLDKAGTCPLAPPDYLQWIRAEVALAAGDQPKATELLAQVGQDSAVSPLAALTRARLLRAAGDEAGARALLEQIVARHGAEEAGADALLELAQLLPTDEAYPLLRRVWINFPRSAQSVAAAKALEPYTASKYRPTWQEVARRAEVLMGQRDYAGAVRELERVMAQATDKSEDACRARYVLGRSHYRQNHLTSSIAAFGDAGTRCEGVDGDYGAKSLYLGGTAQFRKGSFVEAASTFLMIADKYPQSTLADDGLLHAGLSLQEAEDLDGAMGHWRRALKDFPEGDTAPESTWRLAWTLYLSGDTAGAREVAEALGRMPLHLSERDVAAGRYWAARWLLYPDHDAPNKLVEDEAAREHGISGLAAVCREMPWSYYALLAHARLTVLAPELAAELDASRPERTPDEPWVVRRAVFEDPHVRNTVGLARLGLIQEAQTEWRLRELSDATADEQAWFTELRNSAGDWLLAHEQMRAWVAAHPIGTLGPREAQVVRTAYPLRYWEEVRVSSRGDLYDPWLLQGLMREESNFNRNVVSHAGAIGLSQLMPPTAKQVAGWMGKKVDNAALKDPATNLAIGARYLDSLHKQYHGSPFLSLAAYNAGAGRVSQWLERFGNVPTDEYVEHIPFRETRGYVKRVTSTWQTYRWFYGEGDAFPPLEALIPQALPAE